MQHVGARRVLLFGLDGAGKSSFLWMCEHPLEHELPADQALQPTSGVVRLTRKDVRAQSNLEVDLDFGEVGGDARLRPYWSRYVARDVKVLVFMIDASAPERLQEAATQFAAVAAAGLKVAPRMKLLLVASRTDAPGAITAAEVHARLDGLINFTEEIGRIGCVQLALRGPSARGSLGDLLALLANMAL